MHGLQTVSPVFSYAAHLWCTHVHWTAMLVADSRFHFRVTEHCSRFEYCLQTFGRKRFHPLWKTCDFDICFSTFLTCSVLPHR